MQVIGAARATSRMPKNNIELAMMAEITERERGILFKNCAIIPKRISREPKDDSQEYPGEERWPECSE